MKSIPLNNPSTQDAIGDIIVYHDRTKHHPERYANGPGGLDWATQPNPFRRFKGAPAFRLPLAGPGDTPPSAALFGVATVKSQPLTLKRMSLYLELSLGLSARKEIATSSWHLRMNPSSGALAFSFARAIQQPALETWRGEEVRVLAAQQALVYRARCNRAARRGEYNAANERTGA